MARDSARGAGYIGDDGDSRGLAQALRNSSLLGKKDGFAVLDAPVQDRVGKANAKAGGAKPRRVAGAPALRRDMSEDYTRSSVAAASADEPGQDYVPRRRFAGLRFRLRGGLPRSVPGRIAAAATVFAGCGFVVAALWAARSVLLHDPRLLLTSSASIQTVGTGANHLTRAQMLSVFGGDVDRNILLLPLGERRRELESLPWVEHATVMRLLPNRIRVAVIERTPVAFVRQGGHIGLVDANGVLLEMSPDVAADQHYSFPVVTGVNADEPDSTRAARMQLFQRFTQELDAGTEKVSQTLSEVDLSSPEDVIALIPGGGGDTLVHFGDDDFLARYERFEKNIADWRGAHPNLASVDMRYDREAVLEMKAGTAAVDADAATDAVQPAAAKSAAISKVVVSKVAAPRVTAKTVVKPMVKMPAKPAPHAAVAAAAPAGGHLQTAFAVGGKSSGTKTHTTQVAPQ